MMVLVCESYGIAIDSTAPVKNAQGYPHRCHCPHGEIPAGFPGPPLFQSPADKTTNDAHLHLMGFASLKIKMRRLTTGAIATLIFAQSN